MRKSIFFILLFLLITASLAVPSAPIPRKSPEFLITEPSGKHTFLSSFKGKVVMIEFFFLRSPQCLSLARTMNKLNADLGPRGFQPIAIAFPAPGSNASGPLVRQMVDYFKITYPVGFTTDSEEIDQYLSRGNEVLKIPQVVIIDRAGMIRAQTGGGGADGNPKLADEAYLRPLLDNLLKENPSPTTPAKPAAPPSTGKAGLQ